jgi:pimeloyl-ACP methyl ester carboxylesterase
MVSELIAADPVAGAILPDFQELVLQTIERLETDGPFDVELNDGSVIRLTAFQFRAHVAGSIVRRQFLRLIPREYGPMRHGDFSNLAGGITRARTFGMRAAMDCSSGFSAERWRRVASERESTILRGVPDFPYPDVCDAWQVEDLGDGFRSAKVFDRPVQFITGTLDGLTPISNVEEVRESFPRSGHIIVERMGHEGPGIWFGSPEMMTLLGAFLQGGEPVTTRISAPPIDWVLPEGQ